MGGNSIVFLLNGQMAVVSKVLAGVELVETMQSGSGFVGY
jgi:hypothetical protein